MATATNHTPRLAVMDLVAFLVLALGIGLTAGIVLGGAVLLLGDSGSTGGQAAAPVVAVGVR